ncbi:MAG: 3-hydroxyacyl-CoA dehydrogenase family protein [Peptococcaceae bacterium]|nr:3-hydroxyacyl-CoA dehydrogenase family protein [Peptococcaceae bacterium]
MEASTIKKVACLGSGIIGSSWATNFAIRGYPVCVHDISPLQLEAAKKNIANNLEFLVRKGVLGKDKAARAEEMITFSTDIEEAVNDVQFIQESAPEKYEIKQQVLAEIEKYAAANTIFSSSTSGLLITEIAKFAKHPERCVGGHPYNPPHLIPLVEVTKGEKSSPEAVKCAYDFYALLGKEPVILHKETLGFIANRLQRALYREATDLVLRGVCSVEDIDKAVLFGPGLRWAIMGPNLVMHLGGGEQGIKGLINHIRESGNMWLKDMADWKEEPEGWADIAMEGVLREIENRPAEFGKTTEEIIEFRDNMLIELLKLHKKL